MNQIKIKAVGQIKVVAMSVVYRNISSKMKKKTRRRGEEKDTKMIQSITNAIHVKVKQNESKKNNTKHKMIIKKINRIKEELNAKEIKRKLENEPKKKKTKKRRSVSLFGPKAT